MFAHYGLYLIAGIFIFIHADFTLAFLARFALLRRLLFQLIHSVNMIHSQALKVPIIRTSFTFLQYNFEIK